MSNYREGAPGRREHEWWLAVRALYGSAEPGELPKWDKEIRGKMQNSSHCTPSHVKPRSRDERRCHCEDFSPKHPQQSCASPGCLKDYSQKLLLPFRNFKWVQCKKEHFCLQIFLWLPQSCYFVKPNGEISTVSNSEQMQTYQSLPCWSFLGFPFLFFLPWLVTQHRLQTEMEQLSEHAHRAQGWKLHGEKSISHRAQHARRALKWKPYWSFQLCQQMEIKPQGENEVKHQWLTKVRVKPQLTFTSMTKTTKSGKKQFR